MPTPGVRILNGTGVKHRAFSESHHAGATWKCEPDELTSLALEIHATSDCPPRTVEEAVIERFDVVTFL